MSQVSAKLIGAEKLEKTLLALEKKESVKAVNAGLRAGGKIFQNAVKASARSKVGGELGKDIARAIIVRAKKKKRKGEKAIGVQISSKFNDKFVEISKGGNRNYTPNAVEFGHAAPGKGGSGAKVVPPNPFMRPAVANSKTAAVAVILRTMWNKIRSFTESRARG